MKNTNIQKLQMLESFKRLINLALMFLCFALEVGVFAYTWFTYYQFSVVVELRNFYRWGHVAEITVYASFLFAMTMMYGGMRLGYLKNAEVIFSQVFGTIIANVFIYIELSVMAFQLFVPKMFLVMTVEQVVIVIIYIELANGLYKHLFPPRKLLLVHGDRPIADVKAKFETRKDKYKITGDFNVNKGFERACSHIVEGYLAGDFNAVVLWDIPSDIRNNLMKFCYGQSIRIYTMPKITDVIVAGAEELHVFDSPVLLTREYSLNMEQRFLKRLIDIVCSLILIIVSSPFMFLTALAVKLYDGGPIIYKQIRCTKDRKEFGIMKFRSMRVDAEKDGVARLAKKNDDRITPVGKFIRKCRLDELPQLFNILLGDMSFIGPRPERPEIIAQYEQIMPEFGYRMKVKAGLAGFAQVYGKYNTTPYDKLKLDLAYIENYSVWLDLKLMLLTLKILFWPDSTEGVESEQVTALKEALQIRMDMEEENEEQD